MSIASELVSCKTNLSEALGDAMKTYLEILRLWFKQKIRREDFDHRARKLLSPDSVHLHNQFLLALLTKCQLLGSSLTSSSRLGPSAHWAPTSPSKQLKRSKSSSTSKKRPRPAPLGKPSFSRFMPVNPMVLAPHVQDNVPEADYKVPGYLTREMTLPDIGLVHGRLMVTAWDYGLDGVEDDVVRMMMLAIEQAVPLNLGPFQLPCQSSTIPSRRVTWYDPHNHLKMRIKNIIPHDPIRLWILGVGRIQLKNMIAAVLGRRNAYKLREKKFQHSMGANLPQPFLRNTAAILDDCSESEPTTLTSKGLHVPSMKPSVETGLRNASVQLTASSPDPVVKHKVSLFDLYTALKIHKSIIPCHSVYAINMERICHRLWHPSPEEIEQETNYIQDRKTRHELFSQRSVMRT